MQIAPNLVVLARRDAHVRVLVAALVRLHALVLRRRHRVLGACASRVLLARLVQQPGLAPQGEQQGSLRGIWTIHSSCMYTYRGTPFHSRFTPPENSSQLTSEYVCVHCELQLGVSRFSRSAVASYCRARFSASTCQQRSA